MTAPDYAFPHSAEDEARRLALFEQRLDPLTTKRITRLDIPRGARCLEIGGGHGSIIRWLAEHVGPSGKVTATDLQLDFLRSVDAANVEVIRHDIRTETPGTPLAEFHRLSNAAIAPAAVEAGALTTDQAAALVERTTQPDFLACGFVYIGVWGRRP